MYEQYACRGSVPSSILRSGNASRPAVTQFEPLFGIREKLETLYSPCELHQRPQMRCSFISNSIKSNSGAGIRSMRCIAKLLPSLSVRIVTNSEPLALHRNAQSTFDAARRSKLFWAAKSLMLVDRNGRNRFILIHSQPCVRISFPNGTQLTTETH